MKKDLTHNTIHHFVNANKMVDVGEPRKVELIAGARV